MSECTLTANLISVGPIQIVFVVHQAVFDCQVYDGNFVEIFSVCTLEIYHDGRVGAELILEFIVHQTVLICQVMMEIGTQLDWKS